MRHLPGQVGPMPTRRLLLLAVATMVTVGGCRSGAGEQIRCVGQEATNPAPAADADGRIVWWITNTGPCDGIYSMYGDGTAVHRLMKLVLRSMARWPGLVPGRAN